MPLRSKVDDNIFTIGGNLTLVYRFGQLRGKRPLKVL